MSRNAATRHGFSPVLTRYPPTALITKRRRQSERGGLNLNTRLCWYGRRILAKGRNFAGQTPFFLLSRSGFCCIVNIGMKRCPKCGQTFPGDTNFCLQDGTTLVAEFSTETPTVLIQADPTVPMFSSGPTDRPVIIERAVDSPKWPYLVIGVLAMALVSGGLFFLLPKFGTEKAQLALNAPTTGPSPISSPAAAAKPAGANKPATAEPARTLDYASPTGTYSGDWISKMTSYGAEVTITEVNGKIQGKIVWTLRSSPNPKKVNKVGTTAVEYISGTYDPQSRMLDLSGFRKEDPNDIIILDKYKLSATADNQTIVGKSINGEFILRRQ